MNNIYGYCRVSTPYQNLDRQIRNIKAEYPTAVIITESYTGTTLARPNFQKLLSKVEATDTIVFDSVSRLARNEEEGFEIYNELYNKNVELVFLKEPQISTAVYRKAVQTAIPLTNSSVDLILEGINKYLVELQKEQIRLAFRTAQHEVDSLRSRTREGLLTAKINGKTLGHPVGRPLVHKKSLKVKENILKHCIDFGGTLSDKECLALCACSRNTYYKYKRELLKGHQK